MTLKDLTDKLEDLDEDAFASLLELEYTHGDAPKRAKKMVIDALRFADAHGMKESRPPLVLEPQQVVLGQTESADWCFGFYTAMGPMPVVSMQPDLNPIEQVFAKLRHFLRKAAARTVEAVCVAIGQILQAFTPEECTSSFTNSGYRRT